VSSVDQARLALVWVTAGGAERRCGTGYLVADGLVLTARHVWSGGDGAPGVEARAWFSDDRRWAPLELAWESDADTDACLFRVERRAPAGMVALGEYDRSLELPYESCGFPGAAKVLAGDRELRESAHASGRLLPGGGVVRGHYEIDVRSGPSSAEAWRGMSGAPVLAEGRLVGLVRSGLFDGQRLWVTPIRRVVDGCGDLLGSTDLQIVPGGGLAALVEGTTRRGPAALLSARHGVVPFSARVCAAEIDALESWSDSPSPLDVLLLTGPAGSGKTRLLIEHCRRLRARGWRAGFLSDQTPEGDRLVEVLPESGAPTLAVIDDAESRPHLSAELDAILRAARSGRTRMRVVLLARSSGDWWKALRDRSSEADEVLRQGPSLQLAQVGVPAQSRLSLFRDAVERFAELLGKPAPTSEPRLDDPRFGRVLYLHMAALAHVEGLSPSAETLLDVVRRHEERLWQVHCAQPSPSDSELNGFRKSAARLIAALTLRGGASSAKEAQELSERLRGPSAGFVEALRTCLYPARTPDEYVAPLEPDLLGEAVILHALALASEAEGCGEYLKSVFQGAPDPMVHDGLTVLGRIALDHPMSSRTALGLAGWVEANIPERTVSLGELAVWAARTLLEGVGEAKDESRLAERGRLLDGLGNRLSQVGRWEEALETTRQAVEVRRTLAEARPDAYLPELAASLNNLGCRLSDLGRQRDALETTRRAAEIYRELARVRPDTVLPELAGSLNNVAILQGALARPGPALEAAREAVGIYERLAGSQPGSFLPDVAMSLSTQGGRLSDVALAAEALEAIQRAVGIYRELAGAQPDAFLPDLAMGLNNLGCRLGDVGRKEEALEAAREAVAIYRRLAGARPAAFLPRLATSSGNLGCRLGELGRAEEALEATREAVEIHWRLAHDRPEAFLADLMGTLEKLASRLGELGRRKEALTVAEVSLETCRALAGHSDSFRPLLAAGLASLGKRLDGLGRPREAADATRAALAVSSGAMTTGEACMSFIGIVIPESGQMSQKDWLHARLTSGGGGARLIARRVMPGQATPAQPSKAAPTPMVDVPSPHPGEDPDAASQRNIELQRALATWRALPWWKRVVTRRPGATDEPGS